MCISGLREREREWPTLWAHVCTSGLEEGEWPTVCTSGLGERESGQLCALVDWERESGRLCALVDWERESGRLCALVNGERGSSCPEGMVFRCERWLLVDWCISEAGFNLDICP